MVKSNQQNCIEEVKNLANLLDITESNSVELINFYFRNYADSWVYEDFLRDEVRIITRENKALIAELKSINDAYLIEEKDYVILTNYQTLKNMGEIGDCLPNHSF